MVVIGSWARCEAPTRLYSRSPAAALGPRRTETGHNPHSSRECPSLKRGAGWLVADPGHDGRQYKRVGASHLAQLPVTTVLVTKQNLVWGKFDFLFENPPGAKLIGFGY